MIVYGEKVYSINLFNTVVAEIVFVFYSCSMYSSVRAAVLPLHLTLDLNRGAILVQLCSMFS